MTPARVFSTLPLPAAQRVRRWTEAASDRFVESGFRVQAPERFVASMQHRELAALSVTTIVSAGHGSKRVTRSQRQAARAAEDFFLVSVQLDGRCRLAQDGRDTLLQPGDFAIYDTRRPYELQLDEDYAQAVLRVPHRTLAARLPGHAALTACSVAADHAAAGALLAALGGAAEDTSTALLDALRRGLQQEGDAARPVPRTRTEQLARLKRYVGEHLAEPQLGVPRIAAALGLSVSYLHQLFRAEGETLERWIWSQRLAACALALAAPEAAGRSITEIAYGHGFSDAAHFSRSFQRRYGASPSEHRRRALAAR